MNQKPLILATAIIALLVIAGAFWYVQKREVVVNQPVVADPVAEVPVQPEPEAPTDVSDWKTYWNEEYGFEMKYPKEYIAFNDYPNKKTIFVSSPENSLHRVDGIFIRFGDQARTPDAIFQNIRTENEGGIMSSVLSDQIVSLGSGIKARRIMHTAPIGYSPVLYFLEVDDYLIEIEIKVEIPFTGDILKTILVHDR
ncbi:MAG: hypothetical protein WBP40_00520 [Candidatus Moraniibacteriota bacterium]